MKICEVCFKEHKSNYVRFCVNCYHKCRYKSDPKKILKHTKAYYLRNKKLCIDRSKAWEAKNPDKVKQKEIRYRKNKKHLVKAKMKRWRNSHPNRNAYDVSKRRFAVKRATPRWVDHQSIKLIYLNRPVGYQVDHIIPLQGENVCGLHVPWNLQYLSAIENAAKKNKF